MTLHTRPSDEQLLVLSSAQDAAQAVEGAGAALGRHRLPRVLPRARWRALP